MMMRLEFEDLEKIEGIKDYKLIHTRDDDSKLNGLKYLEYVPFFMILINELKNEILKLKIK